MSPHSMRKTVIMCTLAAGLAGSDVRAADELHDFARYQIIIDRLPFGAMSGSADTAPQPPFSARFTYVGTEKEDEKPLTAIIFDKDGNQTHFMTEGEMIGDITVVKIEQADKAPAKLTLKQGLEVATLFMETKTTVGAAPPAPNIQPQPAIPGYRAAGTGATGSSPHSVSTGRISETIENTYFDNGTVGVAIFPDRRRHE